MRWRVPPHYWYSVSVVWPQAPLPVGIYQRQSIKHHLRDTSEKRNQHKKMITGAVRVERLDECTVGELHGGFESGYSPWVSSDDARSEKSGG